MDSHNKDFKEDVGDETRDHVREPVRALESDDDGGVWIDVPNFSRRIHPEYYLDYETSVNNYFEWKPIEKWRKVMFVI